MAARNLVRSPPRLTLDEVQRGPDLLLAVKRAVDEDRPRRNGRFVLTGSANLSLMRRVSETLAGRATYVNLWPLTRRERLGCGAPGLWTKLLATPAVEWPDLLEARQTVPADWRGEVRAGGYPTPAIELDDGEARSLWFDGYLRTCLERDVRTLAAIGNPVDFRRLMRAASLRLGALLNQAELARDTGIPRSTVQRYLNLLEASYQLVRLESFSVNRSRQLIKSPKLYRSDPGLALWLCGAEAAAGADLKNLVLADLLAWWDEQAPAPELLFWRTTTDLDVDFVIESGRRLLPIQVKAAARPGHADTRGLRAFREEHPERFTGGLLLCGGREAQWLSDRILGVPWWRVL